jgi:hypothetical protein
MQSVLAHMSKGSQPDARKVRSAAMYNPAADPDAPSNNDREQLRVATPLGKQMSALSSAEDKMDKELKLKAQVAELSPKYMPQKDTSMMLDLKSSKRGHITFSADAASKDDRSISKQVAAQTTLAESRHERELLSREKAKAALLEKKRKLEASWMKHDWAARGPPKRPGFRAIQSLVAKDMASGASESKIEADEKTIVSHYDHLKASYDSWKHRRDKFGTE